MKIKGTARILLEEITREWEFEHEGKNYTFREYEGVQGRQMWLDGEEIDDFDEPIEELNDMTAYDIQDECISYEYNQKHI